MMVGVRPLLLGVWGRGVEVSWWGEGLLGCGSRVGVGGLRFCWWGFCAGGRVVMNGWWGLGVGGWVRGVGDLGLRVLGG